MAAGGARGSLGCNYLVAQPPFLDNASVMPSTYHGACFAAMVANGWSTPAKLTVQYGNRTEDVSAYARIPSGIGEELTYHELPADGIPPGEVAVIFLSHKAGAAVSDGAGGTLSSLECPFTPFELQDRAAVASGTGETFGIVSTVPVTLYDIHPYGGAASFLPAAALLLPVDSWAQNYVVAGPTPVSRMGLGAPWMTIAASEDETTILMTTRKKIDKGKSPESFKLDAGKTRQFYGNDPTAMLLSADKPIGVWTGNTYMHVKSNTSPLGGGSDSAHQQVFGVQTLGHEYVGAGIPTRLATKKAEQVPYRIVGTVDGTVLTWDPAPPDDAPSTLERGESLELKTNDKFVVRSQDSAHPFAMSLLMPGAPEPATGRSGCAKVDAGGIQMYPERCALGDEDWTLTIPPEQFLKYYAFFVDPTYTTTSLVVTRAKENGVFYDVLLECMGNIEGFEPVGNGDFEVAHVDLYRAGSGGECAKSRHRASSHGPFGITVWGMDYYASYGYPAGGNISQVNTVTVDVPK